MKPIGKTCLKRDTAAMCVAASVILTTCIVGCHSGQTMTSLPQVAINPQGLLAAGLNVAIDELAECQSQRTGYKVRKYRTEAISISWQGNTYSVNSCGRL